MTLEELVTLFLNHKHTGALNDGKRIERLEKPTIIDGNIILVSPNGTKFILGVDDDGTLTTTKI